MPHENVYGICDNKCLVKVEPKENTDAVEARVTTLEGEMDDVENRATSLEERTTTLESDMDAVEERTTSLENTSLRLGETATGNLQVSGTVLATKFNGDLMVNVAITDDGGAIGSYTVTCNPAGFTNRTTYDIPNLSTVYSPYSITVTGCTYRMKKGFIPSEVAFPITIKYQTNYNAATMSGRKSILLNGVEVGYTANPQDQNDTFITIATNVKVKQGDVITFKHSSNYNNLQKVTYENVVLENLNNSLFLTY